MQPLPDTTAAPLTRLTPAAKGNRPGPNWMAFAGMQVAMVAISAFLPADRLDWLTCRLMFGIAVAQCMLAAVWLVLGPGPLGRRLFGAPAWMVVACGLAGVFSRPPDAFGIILSCGISVGLAIAAVIGAAR